ncbi:MULTISPECIES: helix-turn-helix domain-containing protein [unclassified Pseudoalteromonas]|uniref:helix-turn-helix domain-containing protein n=1 Tax=unclassified Pseudoalteromonas TaxID=194690 RepID=UPI0005AA62F4|nr:MULTISPECIES: XRE family transcriptional regulator [unclassified Pseudoalteromonas]
MSETKIITDVNVHLAKNLKYARAQKGWSLDTCAKNTGVSKAMLGQIEREESSPTISKLWQIASGFELPLSYFLTEQILFDSVSEALISEAENPKSISIKTVFEFDEVSKMETFEITLNRQHEHMSEPHNKNVFEHIIVLQGEMAFYIDGHWKALKAGDSTKFSGNQIHGYRNLHKTAAIFHNIICYL